MSPQWSHNIQKKYFFMFEEEWDTEMVSRLGNMLKRREKNKQEKNNKRADGEGAKASFQILLNSDRVLQCRTVPRDTILTYYHYLYIPETTH